MKLNGFIGGNRGTQYLLCFKCTVVLMSLLWYCGITNFSASNVLPGGTGLGGSITLITVVLWYFYGTVALLSLLWYFGTVTLLWYCGTLALL